MPLPCGCASARLSWVNIDDHQLCGKWHVTRMISLREDIYRRNWETWLFILSRMVMWTEPFNNFIAVELFVALTPPQLPRECFQLLWVFVNCSKFLWVVLYPWEMFFWIVLSALKLFLVFLWYPESSWVALKSSELFQVSLNYLEVSWAPVSPAVLPWDLLNLCWILLNCLQIFCVVLSVPKLPSLILSSPRSTWVVLSLKTLSQPTRLLQTLHPKK